MSKWNGCKREYNEMSHIPCKCYITHKAFSELQFSELIKEFLLPLIWVFLWTLFFNVENWSNSESRLQTHRGYIKSFLKQFHSTHTQYKNIFSLTSIHFFVFIEFSSSDSFSIALWYCLQSCPSWIAFIIYTS